MGNSESWFVGKVCAVCGKEFVAPYPARWAYKIKKGPVYAFYCSWKCIQAGRNNKKEENKMAGKPRKKPEEEQPEGWHEVEMTEEEKREQAEKAPLETVAVRSRVTGYDFWKTTNGLMYMRGDDECGLTREEWTEFAGEIIQALQQLGM